MSRNFSKSKYAAVKKRMKLTSIDNKPVEQNVFFSALMLAMLKRSLAVLRVLQDGLEQLYRRYLR